jgi:glycosyltransferase involved in cell wall biosynthesis
MSHIDISVIIPVFNREHCIKKCIASVLDQKNVCFEIIIIDDGSTDNTLQICNEIAEKIPNIKIIHQENAGLASARNVGLDNATGEYITFLDSDDLLAPEALQNMLFAISKYNVDVVVGEYDIISADDTLIGKGVIPSDYTNQIIDTKTFFELNSRKECNFLFTVLWSKLFKKSIWDNLRFKDGIRFAEDEYILPELTSICCSYYLLDTTVYQQITSNDSLIRSAFNINKLNSPESKLFTCKYLISLSYYEYAIEKWGIAAGEILLMTKLANDAEASIKVRHLYKGSIVLGRQLFKHMNNKKRIKFLGYKIIYPFLALKKG